MSKWRTGLFALVALAVAIAVAGVIVYYTAKQAGGAISDYVPADVLYFGKYTGLEGVWQDIRQSKHYADIKEWLSKVDLDKYPAFKKLAYYKVQAEVALGAAIDEKLVLSLVGKECGVAVLENGVAGLFRLGVDTLGKAKIALRDAPAEESYKGVKIYKFGDETKGVAIALVGDILIAANNSNVLKHMLDARTREVARLADKEIYKEFTSRVPPDAFSIGYSDVDRINTVIMRKLAGTLGAIEPEAAKSLEMVKGMKVGGYSLTYSRWIG